MVAKAKTGQQAAKRKTSFARWSRIFLSELATTSNVSAAARKAGIHVSTAYEARRTKPEFNRSWQEALCEGYDHLEMELLHRLRSGEVKPASGAKRGVRSFDNATAFRLLAAHRETAARQRAIRSNQDRAEILLSIDAKLDLMRERRLLDSAVSAYGDCDNIPIMLAGHADRSGSARYNVGLSERRNDSVRGYLTSRGIPDGNITSQGFGESQPRVPTEDGVRELQNRRVEITYGPGSGM